jgi:hypothetical protein
MDNDPIEDFEPDPEPLDQWQAADPDPRAEPLEPQFMITLTRPLPGQVLHPLLEYPNLQVTVYNSGRLQRCVRRVVPSNLGNHPGLHAQAGRRPVLRAGVPYYGTSLF